mmetsp:Transcript_32660/g.36535  ORF Transcript_32660/g.36535 Transcript_32660/m.36535 type:complete len:433 (+) Transcript_32660:82-1380(+)|eukprot:CAMPEP_0170858888 /NCGR_PEP_ID=MMETSP0734-20130129/16345_1 /TAXON_ID=186038 /ORGANISM="Fragilariopsis kerguelensis, Strain L26-C5" /LENGTH=432 /DNA_ID=CAMNT_0011231781 /DNA_START=81 /DNA_END=1379 /DNA_ORIENTATION=-
MAYNNDDFASFTIDDSDYPSNATTIAAESSLSPSSSDFVLIMDSTTVWVLQIVIAKVVGLLSAIGSAYIIYDMIINVKDSRDRKKNLHRSFDRLLLCLCVSDCISSIMFFLASWSIPANAPVGLEDVWGGPGIWDKIYPHASGNTGTCTTQGFFLYIGQSSSVMFTGSIAISFLLQVKYQFREKQMRLAEKVLFGVSTGFPLLTAIIILANRGFNPNLSGVCHIATSPYICGDESDIYLSQRPRLESYCAINNIDIRGKHTMTYIYLFAVSPLVVVLLISIICMGTLFWSVRTQELRAAKFSSAAAAGRDQKQVFIKSMVYIGVFLFVWVPTIIVTLGDFTNSTDSIVLSSFLPLQGVLNVLVYAKLGNVINEKSRSIVSSINERTVSAYRHSMILPVSKSAMFVGTGTGKEQEMISASAVDNSPVDPLDKI